MIVKINDRGPEITLPNKTARIVRAVLELSADIEELSAGHVVFHVKAGSVLPELHKRYRPRPESEEQ